MDKKTSLMDPGMETLLENAGSKFTLVTLAAKRAREINDYYNQLGEGLGRIVPPQVTSVSRKPLSIALEEISNGDIIAMPIEEEDIKELAEARIDDEVIAEPSQIESEEEATDPQSIA
jgi:DNA-directed RNA polymerase subunit omega